MTNQLVNYIDSDHYTDDDLTPNPLSDSNISRNSLGTINATHPAPQGVDMFGLKAHNSSIELETSPVENPTPIKVRSAPEVTGPPPNTHKQSNTASLRLISSYANSEDSDISEDDTFLQQTDSTIQLIKPQQLTSANKGITRHLELQTQQQASHPALRKDIATLDLTLTNKAPLHKMDALTKGARDSITVNLPPEPPGRCSTALQEKIMKALDQDIDFNVVVQRDKTFRNPSIYEKLIAYCTINEYGTNYPIDMFNPCEWKEESYYENLCKVQFEVFEQKQKAKSHTATRATLEFISGTAAPKRTANEEEINKAHDSKKKKH